MTYKPESKLTLGERLAMLRRCLRTGIGLEQLCEIFDASAEDLRKFVKLNDASLSDAFESLVKKEEIQQQAILFISWRESLQLGVRQLR